VGTSNDPQITITLLNEKIAHMAKRIEDLVDINVALQAHLLELSRTPTIILEHREVRNSQAGGRHKEEVHLNYREEGSGEKIDHREAILENPTHNEVEEKMKAIIPKLEQKCDFLSEMVQDTTRERLPW
jgi:hypothetical protein